MALNPDEIAERRLVMDEEARASYVKLDEAQAFAHRAKGVMYGAFAVAALALAVRLIV